MLQVGTRKAIQLICIWPSLKIYSMNENLEEEMERQRPLTHSSSPLLQCVIEPGPARPIQERGIAPVGNCYETFLLLGSIKLSIPEKWPCKTSRTYSLPKIATRLLVLDRQLLMTPRRMFPGLTSPLNSKLVCTNAYLTFPSRHLIFILKKRRWHAQNRTLLLTQSASSTVFYFLLNATSVHSCQKT